VCGQTAEAGCALEVEFPIGESALKPGCLKTEQPLIDQGLALKPNLAWLSSGWMRAWIGEPEVAIEHEARG